MFILKEVHDKTLNNQGTASCFVSLATRFEVTDPPGNCVINQVSK